MAETSGGDTTKTCPYCAETIRAEAFVCRFCGRDLPIVATPPVYNQPECPHCGRRVHRSAMVCAGCNSVLPAGQPVRLRRPPGPRTPTWAVVLILVGLLGLALAARYALGLLY
jgi:DNA-directed RNA polymerase subunit RPC12/RpoP